MMSELVLKTTLVLAAVLAARAALCRASAATRHLVLVLGLAAVIALPLAAAALPALELPWLPAAPPQGQESANFELAPHEPPALASLGANVELPAASTRWSAEAAAPVVPARASVPRIALGSTLLLVWLVGVFAVLARSAHGWWRMARLAAGARELDSARIACLAEECGTVLGLRALPRMRIGNAIHVPLLWGFVRPTLCLPEAVRSWSEARLRVVLLHELAHLRRRDGLGLLAGRCATALHWFNPLVWVADVQARRDCEQACDDAVIGCGERPSSYARHLLEIATGLAARRASAAAGLAVVGTSDLEARLRSILRPAAPRGLKRAAALAGVAVVGMGVGIVGSARLVAGESPTQDPTDEAIRKIIELESAAFEHAAEHEFPYRAEHERETGYRFKRDYEHQADYAREDAARQVEDRLLLAQNYGKRKGPNASPDRSTSVGQEAFSRAYELHHQERFAEAIEAWKDALELGYRVPTSTYNIACAYARLGDSAEAVEWLNRAVELDFDTDYLFEDSDLDPLRGNAAFQALVERVEERDGPRFGRRDRRSDALARYEALDAERSTEGREWYEVGTDLLKLRELRPATDALERSTKLLSNNGSALYNLTCALAIQGDTKRALDTLERAVLAGFDSDERFENDSDLASIRGTARFNELRELNRQLSLEDCQEGWSDKLLGWIGDDSRYSPRRWAPAVEKFRSVTRQHPEIGRGWFNLGWSLHFSRQHAEAAEAWGRAAELRYRTATSTYNVACAHAMAGNKDAALDWLERAVDAGFDGRGHLSSDEDLESLHGDPRFEALRERIGDDNEWGQPLKRQARRMLKSSI